ncbi:MAG: hypothetical protein AAFO69_17590 [Bacteroidota bacterium]
MVKIKKTFGILLALLLAINLSCTQEEVIVPEQQELIDIAALDAKMQTFLAENPGLTSGRQGIGAVDEIINDFLNDELQSGGVTIVSDPGNANASGSSNQNTYAVIYRFFRHDDHFYTTSYEEGINADFTYEGILGLASLDWNFASAALVRWYSRRNGDRVLSAGVVTNTNHPVIAQDTHNRWQPGGVHSPYVPFDGTFNGGFITSPENPPYHNGTWHFEGVMGYSTGNRNIHVYYNAAIHDHLYTNDFSELGNGAHGYVYEGVAFSLN